MPKLAIVDHVVSAGGVERFLHGLIGGMLSLPEIHDWDITLVLSQSNSGGYEVKLPKSLTSSGIRITYIRDDKISKCFSKLANSSRIFGIPGTGRLQRAIPYLLSQYGPRWLRKHAGAVRLWIEDFCNQQEFDVVYFSYPYLMECPRLKAPMVATPHDFNYKHFDTLGRIYRKQIEHELPEWLHKCQRLIVSSKFIETELCNFFPDVAERVKVIRLGIPSADHTPSQVEIAQCRQRLGLPNFFLLTAGWIVAHKNQKVIFEALRELKKRNISIPLVCTGPNSLDLRPENHSKASGYIKEVLHVADCLGLEHGQDFIALGYVSDFELTCLYKMASSLIVSSLYEAGSFPAREAMQVACPVIYSEIPSLLEEVNLVNGNAWTFQANSPGNLAEVVQSLLSHPLETQQKAQRAAQLINGVYSWQKTSQQYLSVFQESILLKN